MYQFYYEIQFVDSNRIRVVRVETDYTERYTAREKARTLVAAAFGHDDFEISKATFQTVLDRIQFDDDGIEVVNVDLKVKIGEQEILIESLTKTVSNQIGIIEALEKQIED